MLEVLLALPLLGRDAAFGLGFHKGAPVVEMARVSGGVNKLHRTVNLVRRTRFTSEGWGGDQQGGKPNFHFNSLQGGPPDFIGQNEESYNIRLATGNP